MIKGRGKTNWQGFTIVELLIVVVVIAILAAITVVAYNGITAGANDSARLSDSKTFEKAVQLRHIEHGASLNNPDHRPETREEILALYGVQSMGSRVLVVDYDNINDSDFDKSKIYISVDIVCRWATYGECNVPLEVREIKYAYWSQTDTVWHNTELLRDGVGETVRYETTENDGPSRLGDKSGGAPV